MKTVYIADDGKEFENEKDCMDYELNELSNFSDIVMLTEDCRRLISPSGYDDCIFINIKNKTELDDITKFCTREGFCFIPTSVGMFYFDDRKYSFVSLEDKIEEAETQLNYFKKAKEELER